MPQINWIYLDDRGGRHSVGVYHGGRTGHLLIHCNKRIIQIDFGVQETRTYSFFVEDELCEVIAEKMANGRFGYEFRVNKTIDTPRNRIRRVENKRNNYLLAAFISGVVIIIAGIFFGLTWYGHQEDLRQLAETSIVQNLSKSDMRQLSKSGKKSIATLHVEEINGNRVGVYYFKTADSSSIRGIFAVADTGEILLANGFPLYNGDAFSTYYLPNKPESHRIELFQPTKTTIQQYISIAFATEQQHNPDVSKEKNLCRVLTVAEQEHWTNLADFIFQSKTVDENPRHNAVSYLRMMRSGKVEQALKEGCWDK